MPRGCGIRVLTFGCRLNSFESEAMRGHAETAGLKDAVIIHTCAVTGEAERQAFQAVRRAVRENPDAKVIVAGCAAVVAADRLAAEPGVSAVLGNAEKLKRAAYEAVARAPKAGLPLVLVGGTKSAWPAAAGSFAGKTKAFVQIQQGCDNRCSYCIVPLLRGRSGSAPEKNVLAQCRAFLDKGYRELVLTGVDISAYGADTRGKSLFHIVKRILDEFPELERLRLSSLDPARNYGQLLGLMGAEPRLMPHLHLSVQSGDDRVLSGMRRRHRASDVAALSRAARAANRHVALGADIIVGFPGETEEEFENTCRLVKRCGFARLHVFPYSPRPGTRAAGMPDQVPAAVKRARAAKLRAIGVKLERGFAKSQAGRPMHVLVEKDNRGYTDNYIFVEIMGEPIEPNSIVRVKIAKVWPDGKVFAKRIP